MIYIKHQAGQRFLVPLNPGDFDLSVGAYPQGDLLADDLNLLLQFLRSAVAVIGLSFLYEPVNIPSVHIEPVGLPERPSSQSRLSHFIPSMMASIYSSVERLLSVSSILRIKVPPHAWQRAS
jgi:hypothetical protein